MSEPGSTEIREFVFRRLTEPMKVFGYTWPPMVWIVTLTVILVAAIFYIAMMYYKDSRSIGPWWASLLGVLRTAVYAILAFVFLLPAIQKYEQTTIRSKAVLLFDTSLSMIDTRDDPPPPDAKDLLKLPSRQDKVLAFIQKNDGAFMKKLTDTNAITAYRFGSGLDEGYFHFANGRFYSRGEWEDLAKHPEKRREVGDVSVMPKDFWSAWLKPTAHQLAPEDWNPEKTKSFLARKEPWMKPADEWNETERERFVELAKYNARMIDKATFEGTNVYQALADTLAREQNNLTRAIVLVSDGRSHLGSQEMIEEIKRKAAEKKIPIIVVGVGAVRPQARIEVIDIRHPRQVQPDDAFRIVAEIKGDGLPNEEVQGVQLEITKVKTVETIKDGVPTKTETPLDITVVEQRPPKKRNPDEKPETADKEAPLEEVAIGPSLILTPTQPTIFDASPRPRAAAEFQIEASMLAQLAAKGPTEDLAAVMKSKPLAVALASLKGKTDTEKKELELTYAKIKKWGLGETAKDEEYRFKVSVKKHVNDTTPGTDHLQKVGGVRVQKKPLSVLIFTSSASKDYQFLRELLIRETQKDLARLTLVFQTSSPSDSSHPIGVVHGVPERRLLTEFPSTYKPEIEITKPESEEAINDLASYDVVVAIDPDWTRLKTSTGANIGRWVENGGGLVILGGPLYTKRLARPGDHKAKLQPIIDVLPVVLKDIDTVETVRNPDSPWKLDFTGATSDLEFLRLTEEPLDKVPFLGDWDAIYGTSTETESHYHNGFYSFYPVKKAAPGSQVLARFSDPKAKTDDNEQMPYFVISDPRSPKRVAWIGSSETWRLRQAKEAYHERFWTKLLRYAGARTQGKVNKRLTLELGGPYKTDQFIQVDASALGNDGIKIQKGEMKLALKPRGIGQLKPSDLEQTLKPKVGSDGIFSVQFRLSSPGIFDVELTVPDMNLTESGTLVVDPSNLEKDDTRPDFDTLYKLASNAEDVKLRMSGKEYDELLKALARPKLEGEGESAKTKIDKDKPRLFFDLSNADQIPTCIDKDESVQKSRGKPEDLWDTGFWKANDGKPILSIVLVVVVGLLSLEWLIRKLLRLA